MDENNQNGQQQYQPPYQPPYNDGYGPQGDERLFKILAYIPLLWLVGLLAAPQNPRVRFHVNQGIVLTICMAVVAITSGILLGVLGGVFALIPFLSFVFNLVLGLLRGAFGLLQLALLALMIVGIVNASKDREAPLPVIGNLFRILR